VSAYDVDHVQSAELESIVQAFGLAGGIEVHVPVLIVPPQDLARQGAADAVGLCVMESGPLAQDPIVLLSSDYWWAADTAERTALVWHELGHCVLGRDHDATLDPRGRCPASLMFPSVTWPAVCLARGARTATEYAQELFGAQRQDL
jgi:hypothetical protein